jgi:hypothetical protein
MSLIALIVLLAGVGAIVVLATVRLFVDSTYRAGPENSWAQRNDLRRARARGPEDDHATVNLGNDSHGGGVD